MAEQQIQALTKIFNENNQILMQNCQNLDLNSRVLSDSAKAIAHKLESLDPSLDRGTDSGRIPFNIKNFNGNPRDFDSWVKQVENMLFSTTAATSENSLLRIKHAPVWCQTT